MLSISIVGTGRLGGALAIALERAGFALENLVYKTVPPSPELISRLKNKKAIVSFSSLSGISSDIVFITTQDSEIEAASEWLRHTIRTAPAVFITSGALSSSLILSLKHLGCSTGSIHPLISVSDPLLGADRLWGAYFCIEGDANAIGIVRSTVEALRGHSFLIDTDKKPLYHAAAVTACGHLVALIDIAVEMLEKSGLPRETAETILLPLIRSTVENLEKQGLADALTGPFARGDVETVEDHLRVLNGAVSDTELQTYLNLGERSLQITLRGSNSNRGLVELQKKVSMAKKGLR